MLRLFVLAALVFVAACGNSRDRARVDGSILPPVDAGPSGRDGGDPPYGYCTGFEPTADDCVADADCACGSCTIGDICGGAGCASECGTDADCTDGWCSFGCCSFCVPSCPGTPCADGQRCDETTGRCGPIPCDEGGAACPVNARCEPAAPGANAAGCRALDCTENGDCDCGTCIAGRCYQRPGLCCPPLPG